MIKTPLLLLGIFVLAMGSLMGGFASAAFGLRTGPGPPGIGIAALSLFDLLLIYAFAVIAIQVMGFGWLAGRVQGISALASGALGALAGLTLIGVAMAALNLMLALILAVPFGTLTYLALFGHFDTAASRTVLALIMVLKLVGLALILLGAPSLLNNRKLLKMVGVSLAFTFVLGLVDAYVPTILISIVDAFAGVVIGVAALVWFVLLIVAGVSSLIKAVQGALPV